MSLITKEELIKITTRSKLGNALNHIIKDLTTAAMDLKTSLTKQISDHEFKNYRNDEGKLHTENLKKDLSRFITDCDIVVTGEEIFISWGEKTTSLYNGISGHIPLFKSRNRI